MPAQIAEYEEAKRTESVSSVADKVSEVLGVNSTLMTIFIYMIIMSRV